MDEIRRKLEIIDRELAGRNHLQRLIGATPLFFPALGLMAGIVLQHVLADAGTGLLYAWATLLGLSVVVTSVHFARRTSQADLKLIAGGATLCFVCLGAIRLIAFGAPAPHDVRLLVGTERKLATVRGRVVTRPYQEKRDWCFARCAFTDPATAFYLAVEAIKGPDGWRPVTGTVRVRVDEPTPELKMGDSIQAHCWLHRFEDPTNPGQFDVAAYLQRNNVYIGASVPSRDAIEPFRTPAKRNILITLRRRFSDAAGRALLDRAPADAPSAGLLAALLLGDRRDIDRATYEAFRRTGLLHLISLSGLHLGILAGFVWWAGKILGLLKRARATVCLVTLGAFLLIVPPRPPTVRAALIVATFCLSMLLRRRAHPLNSLALAAIVLLLIRPTQLFEAGWQLSFAAVVGILTLTPRIENFLHEITGHRFVANDRRTKPVSRTVKTAAYQAIRLLSAGVAAWLGGAGIILYHFYVITPLAAVWTALVFPFVVAILALGFAKMILFFLLPTLSVLLAPILHLLADAFIWIVKGLAWLDSTNVLIGHVPLTPIVFYYGLVLFAAFVHWRRPVFKRALCLSAAAILIASLGLTKWQRTHRSDLRLTCLDVGHGQAILVQLPGKANLLFDAGSLHRGDIGTRVVVPFLNYAGIDRLHAIFASHHDIDHINGIPEIADLRRVDRVYASVAFLARAETFGNAQILARHLRGRNTELELAPETLETGPARVSTLWPVPAGTDERPYSDNDNSIVSLIEFANVRILLCSDIEQAAQEEVLQRYPQLGADIVVAPHHGSARTLHDDFLPALDPAVLLASCDEKGRGRATSYARGRDTRFFSTATNGAVTVCVDNRGVVEVATHRITPGD